MRISGAKSESPGAFQEVLLSNRWVVVVAQGTRLSFQLHHAPQKIIRR